MKYPRSHFEAEAKRCVPYLSPKEREAWIDKVTAEHPGITEAPLTGSMGDTFLAMDAWSQRAKAAEDRAAAAERELRTMSLILKIILGVVLSMAFILLMAKVLHAQDDAAPTPPPPPPDLPLPLEPSDREKLKDLWVEGFLAFAKVEDANVAVERYSRQAAEAKVDVAKRQKDLDEANNKIALLLSSFREKYKANIDRWCLTRQLGWLPKGDKPCPAIFDDTQPSSH